jgi:hypothetical protein
MTPRELAELRYEPLADRPSKVQLEDLGSCPALNPRISDWLETLPRQLAANGIRQLRDAIIRARVAGAPVIAALGGHVVKTGCGPYLIDWINRGLITGLALNGSAAIHDLELAIAGHTSEDVGPRLLAGCFGFARETTAAFVDAARLAHTSEIGLGEALGEIVAKRGGPGIDQSLLVAANRSGVPLSVHVAIGTDIVHMSADVDGSTLGEATLCDFRLLCGQVAGLAGGVWLNLGSAVLLPEVFLKAVSVARNLGHSLDGLVTANLDFEQKYRGLLNVLARPGSEGIPLTGHHEIMIPLLHALVTARWEELGGSPQRVSNGAAHAVNGTNGP